MDSNSVGSTIPLQAEMLDFGIFDPIDLSSFYLRKEFSMRAYGMGAGDFPRCCPGHDKFSLECYNNRRSQKKHTEMTKVLHRRGRRRDNVDLAAEMKDRGA